MTFYKEVPGNLLDLFEMGSFDAIGHGANCFCTMGSGIAKEIHERFPEAYEADCKTIKGDKSKLGTFSYWDHPNGSRLYNLYTQYNYGREPNTLYLDYSALEMALRNMRDNLNLKKDFQRLKVGFPQIGCGLAQGDWKRVKETILTVFDSHSITVVIFLENNKTNFKSQKLL